ncbi:MAG: alpha-mannosidase [Alphaproteobacteria bacterium PA3]|nr:MAG: alpha-mannosidase [Alphaproteobacteria bacterium PA3]
MTGGSMIKVSALQLFAYWLFGVVCLVAATPTAALEKQPLRFVDPFIGTDGTGHVFPGAVVPFGMVAPGPDMEDRGWSYSSGYQYQARSIMGFSNTHISGAGIGELGDVLLQPCSGTKWTSATTNFRSGFDKSTEEASPGYYAVTLKDHGVRVELTAGQRVAVQRYRFERAGKVQVLVDLQHGILFGDGPRVLRSNVQTAKDRGEISGTIWSKNWVTREASFVLRFDRPIARIITLPSRPGDEAPRLVLEFDLGQVKQLEARIALSTVDVAGAKANLAAFGQPRFEAVVRSARSGWNSLLQRIEIEGSAKQKRIFYSALYRTLIHPSDIADVDGRVRGPTGEVIRTRTGQYYSTLSLWDTFRGVHPLFTLIVPERVDGMVQTLLDHHRAQGYLPLWTAWGQETWTMIGNPALPVIADAVVKGFSGFDREEALAAMIATSTKPRPNAPSWAQQDWMAYEKYGYLPYDLNEGEAVSKTLEYGIGDDAVARVARHLGKEAIAQRFEARAAGYRKLFDPATQTMRARNQAGGWRIPFDPLVPTSPMNNPGDYTEANAWQYTATPALHDVDGFRTLVGGKPGLTRWLDTFFSLPSLGDNKHLGQEALIGQYAHGNEPSHHIAWLYAYSDAPERGYDRIAQIARTFYSDRPDGIIGNDDCGQMSAWYIFATLGFYPAEPASGRFTLGRPLVSGAKLHLANGKTLQIDRSTSADVLMRGQTITAPVVEYQSLMAGGRLSFPSANPQTPKAN